MPSTESVDANREIQRTEARSRDTSELPQADKDLNAGADSIDTDTGGDDAQPAARQPQPQPEPEPPRRVVVSPFDQRRMDIIASYKNSRNQDTEDADQNATEIRNLSMDGIPRELTEGVDNREEVEDARQPEPPPSARTPRENEQAEPPAEERKHKLIVRGKDTWVTDAELVEHAQKALAADDYLGDAKSTLQRARELETRLNASLDRFSGQPAPAGTHSTGQDGQPGAQPQPEADATPDPFEAVVEQVQYGDKAEAAKLLREAVSKMVAPMSAEQVRLQRLQTEHSASTRVVEAFTKSHDDIAKDPMAQAAIRARVYDLQREDIKGLNIMPEDKIPGNPDHVANMHMQLRTDRAPVRDVQTILDKALTDYKAWRGQSETAPQPAPAPERQQHQQPSPQQPGNAQPEPQQTQVRRVEVSLNRDARRAAIPQQPERTVAPRPNPQPPAQAQPKDRADVVKAMQDRRNILRGKVTT